MYRLIVALMFIFSTPSALLSQSPASPDPDIIFNRFTSEQGLANDIIHTVYRDKKGFLWIGTANGLCRYDGSRFVIYRNDPADSTTISNNDILSITQDEQGRIWAGTFWKGLNLLDENKQQFTRFNNEMRNTLPANAVYDIHSLSNNRLVITFGGMAIFDLKTNTYATVAMPLNNLQVASNNGSKSFSPYKVFIDSKKRWWLNGEAGVALYNPLSGRTDLLPIKEGDEEFTNHSAWDCQEDNLGNTWIASGAGLFEYKQQQQILIQHYPSRFSKADAKSMWVKNVCCKKDGTIWFGSNDGLFHYDPASGRYAVYRNHPKNKNTISSDDINCLYEDNQGILWIGTTNGLNAVYPSTSAFRNVQSIPGKTNSLQSNIVKAAFKDEQGNVWVGTALGLDCIDAITDSVTHYRYHEPTIKSQAEYFIMPILQHDASSFWIGTWGTGMQLFDYRKKKFIASYTHDASDPATICSNFIHAFCKDEAGNLWISTWNGGIDKFYPKEKRFEHYNANNKESGVSTNYLNKIIYAYNTIWATGTRGLLKYNKSLNHFEALPVSADIGSSLANAIGDIAPDGKGNFYISSFAGLIRYSTAGNSYKKIHNGLDIGITGILFQNDSSTWLATGDGLKLYNPGQGTLKHYSLRHGLPISYFPVECYFYKAPDGEVFVSSNNGLIRFYPSNISPVQKLYPIYFTSLKIDNKDWHQDGDVSELKRIELSYEQNYFSINFASLNLINPGSTLYEYKMDGLDDDWVMAGNNNEVVYPDLPPGNYTFRARVIAENKSTPANEISLVIRIHPPWWKTWWFISLTGLVIISSIYLLYKLRINRIIAEQKLRNNIARDLHDDIGSTLSGIKLFSGMVLKKVHHDPEVSAIVERIGERSEKMIDAMSDIVWSIHTKNDELEDLIVRMKTFTAEMLEPKGIRFTFLVAAKDLKTKVTPAARKEIYLLYKEVLNNIVKHAAATVVQIELKVAGKNLELLVRDNGKGFDTTQPPGGNGLMNMKDRATKLHGELSIHSANDGTTIKLVTRI